jgi:hypothetical protein
LTNLPVPVPAQESAGNLITGALWNASVYNGVTFLLNPPIFAGWQNTSQSLSTTAVAITMDSETADSYGGHSTTTNTSRYVAQVAGYYMVWGCLAVNGATSQSEILTYVAKNGSEVPGSRTTDVANSSHTYVANTAPVIVQMNANDYVELYGIADGTTPTTHGGGTPSSALNAIFIHA